MINIVHPKVMGKPPIYKQIQLENKSTYTTEVSKSKKTTSCLSNEINKKVRQNKVTFDTEPTMKMINNERNTAVTSKINDCNQNVIEPNSCSFEKLCLIINDLEHNSDEKNNLNENGEFKNQMQAEKDYSQTIGYNSTYEDIMSYLKTLEEDTPNFGTANKQMGKLNSIDNCVLNQNHQQSCCSDCNRESVLKKIATNTLKDELATAHIQLEEKESTIQFLKTELKNERKLALDKLDEQKKEKVTAIQSNKIKYQNIVKRHQKFIEQIIAEKTDLTDKCNTLAQRIKEMEAKHQRELKAIAERHTIELQRAKEICAASEKVRREKWLEAKTTKIKEMTVKGLEPELRNMVEQHQREIQDLRSIHTSELQDVELRTIRRTNHQLEQLRLELTESYDKMLNKEKEAMKKRYQDKLDEQDTILLAQKKKHFNDLQEEKRKFAEQQKLNDAERDDAIKKACAEYYKKYDEMSRKFENDKKTFQESIIAERDAWMCNNQRQYNAKLAIAETRIRDECIRERDKQIELIIVRLEKETNAKTTNLQKSFGNKTRCLTEKYEADLQVSRDSEKFLKDRLESSLKRLQECEINVRNLETSVEKLNVELHDSYKLIDKLTLARDNAKKIARQEIESEKKQLEEQIASLHQEISKSNFDKEAIMGQIYSRLKLVIAQKDARIKQLLKRIEELEERCDQLEQIQDQLRREYILKCL